MAISASDYFSSLLWFHPLVKYQYDWLADSFGGQPPTTGPTNGVPQTLPNMLPHTMPARKPQTLPNMLPQTLPNMLPQGTSGATNVPPGVSEAARADADKASLMTQVASPGRSAYSMGAPVWDTDAQTFARNLFMGSEKANRDLEQYRKSNPNAGPDDPNLMRLQQAAAAASVDAQAGIQWANMSESGRMSVLTQGEKAAGLANATNMTRGFANEQANAAIDQWKPDGTMRPTNLMEDLDYYNQTGVMRGGAGEGTATTQAGGVISAPDKNGARALLSPYGTGSVSYLNEEQMKKRPEALIEGIPASQYFDKAAMRQGRTFTVGGTTYSPDLPPAKAADAALDEAKRKAEEERRKLEAKQLFQPK